MTEKDFLRSYRGFLMDVVHISKGSAYCYVTYLRNACKLPGMENHLALITEAKATSLQVKYAEELCDAIDEAYNDPLCIIKRKDLDNSHTAAHVLLAYVSGLHWVKHKGVSVVFTQIFSARSVAATFRGRLRTQDRIYDYGAFPTNLISKLATKHKVRGFWDKMIAETKIIYDKSGKHCYFYEIEQILFGNDGHAYFKKGGKIHTIYTLITKTGLYRELNTAKLRDLSLDHDYPVESALKDMLLKKPMPELQKLGDDILRFKQTYLLTHPRAKNPEIISEYEKIYCPSRLSIDEPALLKEVQDFIGTLSLTIMDQAENSAKGKRT